MTLREGGIQKAISELRGDWPKAAPVEFPFGRANLCAARIDRCQYAPIFW